MEISVIKLQKEVVKYLKSRGWNPIVIGEVIIQHQPDQLKFNNEVVIKFTGGKKQNDEPKR